MLFSSVCVFCPLKISLMTVWCIWHWFLQCQAISFISLWKAGRWRLVSCFHSYFSVCFFIFNQCLIHKLPLTMQKKKASSCAVSQPHGWRGCGSAPFCAKALEAGTSLLSLFSAHSHIRPAGRLENASLCLQIVTRISLVLFTFVPAICLCFLRLFLCFNFSIPASKRRASLSVFVWCATYFQEHDTDKKRGFKAILVQVNSGNHLCKCSSVVLCEKSILTGGKDLWSEEVQTAHIQLFHSHLEGISPSVRISCSILMLVLLALDKNERSGP